MKQKLIALFVVLLFAAIVVAAAEKAAKESAADILIARIKGDYEKAVSNADAFYEKSTAPMLKRYGKARDKRILKAANIAIERLSSARKGLSELDGVRMEQEIEKMRKSIDDQVGDAPKVTPRASVLAACGVSFKGHRYLGITSNANWKEASALCRRMGGHLVYIETPEELAFLAKAFRGMIWVGATDAHKEGDWRWGNRKPVAGYVWFPTQPDNKGGTRKRRRNENCAALITYKGKRLLNDISFDNNGVVGFICEWE